MFNKDALDHMRWLIDGGPPGSRLEDKIMRLHGLCLFYEEKREALTLEKLPQKNGTILIFVVHPPDIYFNLLIDEKDQHKLEVSLDIPYGVHLSVSSRAIGKIVEYLILSLVHVLDMEREAERNLL